MTTKNGLLILKKAVVLLLFASLPLSHASYAADCVSAPTNAVAWWQAEGDGTDLIGGNNGVLHGGAGYTAGMVGRAFQFDGTSGYFEVPDSPSLRMTNVVTIEFWAARQRLNNSYGDIIVEKGGDWTAGNQNYEVGFHIPSYNYSLVFLYAGGWRAGGSVADTNWHHCAVVARNGDVDPILYIDGVQQPITYRDGSSTINLVTSQAPLHIGAQLDWNYYGQTWVDELGIYDRALSAAEIQAIYAAGGAGKCATSVAPNITRQPQDVTVPAGSPATFTANVSGSSPLVYQWYHDGTAVPNGTSSSLNIANTVAGDAGVYYLGVTNTAGFAISSNATLTVNPPPSCAAPPAGLAAWWQAENDATDYISANNGALHGGVAYTNGEVRRGFSFDGATGYIEVPDSPSLRMTNSVSIEFWVARQRLNPPYGEDIIEKGGDWTGGNLNYEVSLHTAAYNYSLVFLFAGGWRAGGSIADTNWHHCAVVANQGDADPTLYIDGVQQPVTYTAGASTINLVTSPAPLHIGAQIDWNYYSKTLVDEVSIYNRPLTAAEVQELYAAGASGKCTTPSPPSIVSQPQDRTAWLGLNSSLTVGAAGTPPLAYQWFFEGNPVSDGTGSALAFNPVTADMAGAYSVIVTNNYGSVTSVTAQVRVSVLAPSITTQPQNRSVSPGANTTLSVTATGSPVLAYQWNHASVPITGATSSSLLLTNIGQGQAGAYNVIVTNSAGSVTSAVASVTVVYPPAAVRIVNTTGQAGYPITVPINITANGNENAISFSLQWNTAVLNFAGASVGSNAPNAALLINDSQTNSRRVGFSLALNPGDTLNPGTQQVLLVTFNTAVLSTSSSTLLAFTSLPLAEHVVDANARTLSANWFNGTLQLTPSAFEADVNPRPDGDKVVDITDWVMVGRFAAGLDSPTNSSEFQRADCAPRSTGGDGEITVTDWVQAGRYAAQLDPLTLAGGPTTRSGGGKKGSSLAKTDRQVHTLPELALEGQTVTVPIMLEAQGNENAVGLSVSFDTNLLSYTSAVIGQSVRSGGQFVSNTTQAGIGRLGFLVSTATGMSFTNGSCEILKITFRASPTNSGDCFLGMPNSPVYCQVADANANNLPASYSGAAVSVKTPPELAATTVTNSNGSLTLSWPEWATNFVLQSAATPSAVPTDWTNVAANVVIVNHQQTSTVPATNGAQYYRLKALP